MLNLIAYIIIPAYTILFVKGYRVVYNEFFRYRQLSAQERRLRSVGSSGGSVFLLLSPHRYPAYETETKRNLPGSLFTCPAFLCHHYPLSAGGDAV